jgi:hypothetical protein
MRSAAEFAMVERLVAEGLNDCDVSRRTGIPRTTVRDWRQTGFEKEELGRLDPGEPHQHDFTRLPPSYAYLLGLYLGDGCISQHARGVYRLRITLDSAYPMIIAACRASMARVMPSSRASVQVRHGSECVDVGSYSKHWPCFLPQHAPGPKHDRRIVLADWQRQICDKAPELLLRGLIHSDGCRSMNRVQGRGKIYAYSRYSFTNHSPDIRALFCEYLDRLGIAWRQMNWKNISVARREAVAKLDAFVGPKR